MCMNYKNTFVAILYWTGFSTDMQICMYIFRVMVLDRGKIREYDAPSSLLKNKRTLFFNMVQDAGLI